jgi:hypothetical protein
MLTAQQLASRLHFVRSSLLSPVHFSVPFQPFVTRCVLCVVAGVSLPRLFNWAGTLAFSGAGAVTLSNAIVTGPTAWLSAGVTTLGGLVTVNTGSTLTLASLLYVTSGSVLTFGGGGTFALSTYVLTAPGASTTLQLGDNSGQTLTITQSGTGKVTGSSTGRLGFGGVAISTACWVVSEFGSYSTR